MTHIKFHGVSFGYRPDRLILRDINLTLTHGIYAIAGPYIIVPEIILTVLIILVFERVREKSLAYYVLSAMAVSATYTAAAVTFYYIAG